MPSFSTQIRSDHHRAVVRRLGRRRNPLRGITAFVCILALALSGCTTPDGASGPAADTDNQIVIGAEQEPDCADWIATCAAAIWGSYTMRQPTLPRAFVTREVKGQWMLTPSNLLAGEPEVTVTDSGKQVITYRIAPEAQWSDGTPITGKDFEYTGL